MHHTCSVCHVTKVHDYGLVYITLHTHIHTHTHTHIHTHTLHTRPHICTNLHTLLPFSIHTFNATSVGFSLWTKKVRLPGKKRNLFFPGSFTFGSFTFFFLGVVLVLFDLGGVKAGAAVQLVQEVH